MTDAGGNNTMRRIATQGEATLWEIKNDSWDSGETLPILTAAPITTSSIVVIAGATNETTGETMGGSVLTANFDSTNQHFGATESGVTADTLRILFWVFG